MMMPPPLGPAMRGELERQIKLTAAKTFRQGGSGQAGILLLFAAMRARARARTRPTGPQSSTLINFLLLQFGEHTQPAAIAENRRQKPISRNYNFFGFLLETRFHFHSPLGKINLVRESCLKLLIAELLTKAAKSGRGVGEGGESNPGNGTSSNEKVS